MVSFDGSLDPNSMLFSNDLREFITVIILNTGMVLTYPLQMTNPSFT